MILLCWIFLVFDIIFQIFFVHSGITAVASFFIISVHFIFCICYTDWKNEKREDWAELSYKEFKNLYAAMPNDFCLKSSWVSYNAQSIEFKSYLDYLRYKRFLKRKEKWNEKWNVKIEKMKSQAELIKKLKEGLKKAERENDEWVKCKIGRTE